jgi:1-acyl-sn-glycerol-3-phosphate acyltransferase
LVSLHFRRTLKQRWSRQLVEIFGITLVKSGEKPQGLVISNHISFLDIFVINAVAPMAFVSKNDVLNWPVIGWLSRHAETIFLQRGSRRAAHDTREALTQHLHGGGIAAVFPEGTTTTGDHLLPFHGALFQSAIDAGVPVTPLVIRYRSKGGLPSTTPAYIDDLSLWDCIRAIVREEGLCADVRVLPLLESCEVDRRHLSSHAHRLVAHALG